VSGLARGIPDSRMQPTLSARATGIAYQVW